MIDSICTNYPYYKDKEFENPKLAILSYTATGKFTKIVREVLGGSDGCNIHQGGIDFDGWGEYSMKGADVRYFVVPAYTNYKNTKIVS